MKNQQSLSFLLLTVCLLLSSSLMGKVTKTVDVATAGTLPTLIAASEKDQITHLTLTGNLNGTDIRFIREMAGLNVKDEITAGKLSVLDLSKVNIVAGGDYYFRDNREGLVITNSRERYASDNVIGKGMFSKLKGLTQVILPNSLTSIDAGAFLECSGLTSVIISDHVNSIGNAAFALCTSLNSIILGKNVTSIGTIAFYFCDSLTSIKIPKSVTSIEEHAFSQSSIKKIHCEALTPPSYPSKESAKLTSGNKQAKEVFYAFTKSCKIYVPKGTAAAYKNAEGWKSFKNIIEE
ncbi:MAG: leucine-rich repeat domain-containing protein [Bacteroidales bacterium]|nr:leucine-rich repeat domain-containing protein [Bacteroidales bacterium]